MRPPLEFASRVDDLLREAAMRNVPTPARERPPFSDSVVADALPTSVEEALANAAVKGPPGGRHWDKLARYAIPGAILVAVAAVVVLAPRFIRAGQRARPSALEISRSTRLTADEGIEMQPAISPDGRLVAYAAGPALRMRIFIRPATGGRTIRLTEDSMAFEYKPRWSPDGSQILYRTPDGVFVTSALGGVSHRIASNPPIVGEVIYSVAWAPDGRRVLVSRGSDWGTAGPIASDGMSIVFLDGGAERRVPTSVSGLHSCDWSPEGEWVACVSGNPSWASAFALVGNIAPSALVLVRLTDGSVRDVTGKASLNQSPVWSANGRLLYFVSNRQGSLDIYAVPVSASGEVGEPRRVTTGLGAQSIDLATDGRRLVYNVYQARANIWSVPIPDGAAVDAATAEPLTTGNQVVEAMRVSRDHKWLVYDSDLHGSADIFRIPVAGGQPERLTRGEADEFAGDLSPDGQLIAYHAYEEGSRDIFVQRLVDGRREQVTNSRFEESFPLWSPDGAALAFHDQSPGRTPGTARGLFVTRRDRVGRWSEPRALREDAGSGSWSPDGRSLIAATVNTIEVIDADSGPPRVIYARRPGSADPQVGGAILAEDGRTVFFKSVDDSGRASLWSVPVTGGRPRLMVTFTDLSRPSTRGDFAVGAGRFFFALADRQSDIWVADVVDR